MNQIKHTPGPWILGQSYTNDYAIREPEGECVAVTCSLLDGEDEANARLIAASPELLEVLKEAIQEEEDYEFGLRVFTKWLDKAKALIEKIEGEAE